MTGSDHVAKDAAAEDAVPKLAEKLAERKSQFAKQAPEQLRQLFASGVDQVRQSGLVKDAKQVGDTAVTEGTLTALDGSDVELKSLWADGPVVLLWYRGGWCPYCKLQLETMQSSLPMIEQLGAKLIALTPELPPKAAATSEKLRIGYRILSDPDNQVARKFGLVFKLSPAVAEVYRERVKLAEFNGNDSDELPLSAVYVIDRQGVIRYAFLDADYTQRAEPADILAALQDLE